MGQAVVRDSFFFAAVHRNTCSVAPHVPLFGVSENIDDPLVKMNVASRPECRSSSFHIGQIA